VHAPAQGGKKRRRRKPTNQNQAESAKANEKGANANGNHPATEASSSSMLLTQTTFSPPATPPLEKGHKDVNNESSALFLTEEEDHASHDEGDEEIEHQIVDGSGTNVGAGGDMEDEDSAGGLRANRTVPRDAASNNSHNSTTNTVADGAQPLSNPLILSTDEPPLSPAPPQSAPDSEGIDAGPTSSSKAVSGSQKSRYFAQRPQPPGPWVTHLTNCDFYFTAPPPPTPPPPAPLRSATSVAGHRGERPTLDEPLTPDGMNTVKTTAITTRSENANAGGNGRGMSSSDSSAHGLFICKGDTLMHIILRNPHVGRTPIDLDSSAKKKTLSSLPLSSSSSSMPASAALAAESMLRSRPAATTTLARVALEHGFDW
jgi:hypothetical protein